MSTVSVEEIQLKVEKALSEKYVMVSWTTLLGIIIAAGASTIGGAWIAARTAIESAAAKQTESDMAELHDKAKRNGDAIQAILTKAEKGELVNVTISGELNVEGNLKAKQAEFSEHVLVGIGGTGTFISKHGDKPAISIGYGGAGNGDKQMRWGRTLFFRRVDMKSGVDTGTMEIVDKPTAK